MHIYQVRPRKDKRGVDFISDVLPFDRLCYAGPNAISSAIQYAKFCRRSHDAPVSSILEFWENPGHRKFVYPVMAAVTGPALTFAPPAFFGAYSKN
jgi:hypothetical protein